MTFIESAAMKTDYYLAVGSNYISCETKIKRATHYGFICVSVIQGMRATRFVTQEKALSIAIAANQRISLHDNHTKLSPEDIKDDPLYKGT